MPDYFDDPAVRAGRTQYAVMLEVRSGMRLNNNPLAWEFTYSTVTWSIEDDEETAQRNATALKAASPIQVRRAWVEERP